MAIFLFDLRDRKVFFHRDKLEATSCKAAIVPLTKRVAEDQWTIKCKENNLDIDIISEYSANTNVTKKILYTELANQLMFISQNTHPEAMERTFMVVIKLKSNMMNISAMTEGKYLAKMRNLQDENQLLKHIQATVKTKEFSK